VIGSKFKVQGSKVIIYWHVSLYSTTLRINLFPPLVHRTRLWKAGRVKHAFFLN